MSALNEVHRRYNPLLDEWVLVSPQRNERPWQGRQETVAKPDLPSHDPGCYLCPGNERAGGIRNPNYSATFVFDNDFPAITSAAQSDDLMIATGSGLMRSEVERGICRVLCFHPDHNKTLAELDTAAIESVVEAWSVETERLDRLSHINHIQIFENKGAVMGCSNPHPHGQIWAQEHIPSIAARKIERMERYYAKHSRTLLSAYLSDELKAGDRLVYQNACFAVLVPFWAVWPFETMVLPKRAVPGITQLGRDEKRAFADAIGAITRKYDRVFDTSFPYSSGIHQKPCNGKSYPGFHMHMQFFPPLLRSASVRKFMVGYEMFGESQRDILPETAAEILRKL